MAMARRADNDRRFNLAPCAAGKGHATIGSLGDARLRQRTGSHPLAVRLDEQWSLGGVVRPIDDDRSAIAVRRR
jgi:hypothetical protein